MQGSTSLGVMIGVIILDLILAIIFGLVGQGLIAADNTLNETSLGQDLSQYTEVNSSEVSVLSAPSWMQGFSFSLSVLPWWMVTILLIPQIMMIAAGIWWIRGTG